MSLGLTDIPDDFGSGGANLSPNGSSGSPSLKDILVEHKDALDLLATGSVQTVATIAALALLDASGFGNGDTWCYVQTLKAYFCCVASTQAESANVRVAALNKTGFLWIRAVESTAWWTANAWSIDPANTSGLASDENTGASASTPLLTWAEYSRRTRGRNNPGTESYSVTITLMSNTADTDCPQIHWDTNTRIGPSTITVNGTVTATAVGSISVAVAKNATTNQGNEITVPGFNWAPYVGCILRLVSTPTTTAVIAADLGSNTARLSEQTVVSALGTGFTAGQTVEIAGHTQVPGFNIGACNNLTVTINDCKFTRTGTVFVQNNALNASAGLTLRRCELAGSGGVITSPSGITLDGCSITSAYNLYGSVTGAGTEVINAAVYVERQASGRHHIVGWGTNGGSIEWADGEVVRINSDFHAFDLPSAGRGLILDVGTNTYFAAAYYGSGNHALSAGIVFKFGSNVFYPTAIKPVMDAGLGFVHGSGNGTTAEGTAAAFSTLPLALTAKLCAMVAI